MRKALKEVERVSLIFLCRSLAENDIQLTRRTLENELTEYNCDYFRYIYIGAKLKNMFRMTYC